MSPVSEIRPDLQTSLRGLAILTFSRRLLALLKPHQIRVAELFLYVALGIAYNVGIPLAAKYLIDSILPRHRLTDLLDFILVLLGISVFNAFIALRRVRVGNGIVLRIMISLQERIFVHLQKLSHNFYARTRVGDLISRLSNDLQVTQQAILQATGSGIFMICNLLTAIVVLLILNPLIGTLLLIIVPPLALSYRLLAARFEQVSAERQKLTGEVTAAAQENISAHSVIKAFELEQTAIGTFRVRLLALMKSSAHLTKLMSFFEANIALAVAIGQLAVLGIGGYLVMGGYFTLGTMLAVWGLLPSIFSPMTSLASVAEIIQAASGSMDRVMEVLEQPVAVVDAPGAVALPPLTHGIRLENVTFSYGDGHPVLHNLSIVIPAGTNIAIVGPSGSGKSTMVHLLLRFWDPEQGRVLFDVHDLRGVTLTSLRAQIGVVFQETFIFDATVRENIAIGRVNAAGQLDATNDEIITAAKRARLDSYINTLPQGYNTLFGERGVRMSGGQRQRLAIARALMRNPRILIFDEATASLDAQTEREFMETLNEIKWGRTIINITYRPTTAALADHIYVVDKGHIVEQGTHDQLLRAGGLYRRLYQEQLALTNARSK